MAIAKVVLSAAFLPLAAGMACRSWLPAVADRVEGPIATVAKIVLVAGTVALLFAAAPAEWALRGSGRIPAFAAFVVLGLLVGHVVGGPREEERLVLALSVACRHPAIALAVAEANFPDSPNLALAILLYVVVSVVVSAVYLAVERRRLLAEAPAS
jgi:BASS family bile acid:Na+ symporter